MCLSDWDREYRSEFGAAADRRPAKNRDDYNHEHAGRDVGRIRRFLPGDLSPEALELKRSRDRATLTVLEILLLNDPVYAEAYAQTWAVLHDAETSTADALGDAEDRLAEIIDQAAELPDGTLVFQAEDGRVFDEHGREINPATADSIAWPGNAPTYEEYRTARDRIDALREYQVDVLGKARERLEDRENPMKLDELKDMQRNIDDSLNEIIGAAPNDVDTRNVPTLTSNSHLPDLGV